MNTAHAGRVRRTQTGGNREGMFLILVFACLGVGIVVIPLMLYALVLSAGARPVGMSDPVPVATPLTEFPAVPTPLPPAPVQAPQPAAPASDIELPSLSIQPWHIFIFIVWVLALLLWLWTRSEQRDFAAQFVPWFGALLLSLFIFLVAKGWEIAQNQISSINASISGGDIILEIGIGLVLLVVFGIVAGVFSKKGWGALVATLWVFLPFGILSFGGGIPFWLLEVGIFLGWAIGMYFSTSYSDKTKMPAVGMPNGTTVDYARRFNSFWEMLRFKGSKNPDRDQVATGSYGWFAIAVFSSLGSIAMYLTFWQFPMHIGVVLSAWCFFAFWNSQTRMKKSDASPGKESMRLYGIIFTLAGVVIAVLILWSFGLLK